MRTRVLFLLSLFIGVSAFSAFAVFSWAIPTAKGVAVSTAPSVNSISGSYRETKLRSGPDSLATVGHYKDTICLIPIGATPSAYFKPAMGVAYILSWAKSTGRGDSLSFAFWIKGYSVDNKVICQMGDTILADTMSYQIRLPLQTQIVAHHFSVTMLLTPDAGADSAKPWIFHEWYLQALEPSK